MSNKFGFTLAEVLITLAIIGVVAVLTIPTLISNLQERAFHTKWKECYSILNNAFNLVLADDPNMLLKLEDGTLSKEFVDSFLSKLYVVDKCGRKPYATNTCDIRSPFPVYKWSGIESAAYSDYLTLAGGSLLAYDFCMVSALLKNGASISIGGSHSDLSILVDVNNFTVGPNVIGKDVYAINIITSDTWDCHKKVRAADAEFMSFGASGSRCMGDTPRCSLGDDAIKFGVRACSPEVGTKDASYLVEASGIGCSYKYLYEK